MSKEDQIKAVGAAKAASTNRSEASLDGEGHQGVAAEAINLAKLVTESLHTEMPAKKKRAPRGTFDRKTYQRELMRKRRQKEKRE